MWDGDIIISVLYSLMIVQRIKWEGLVSACGFYLGCTFGAVLTVLCGQCSTHL